jgi:hypothetical protein
MSCRIIFSALSLAIALLGGMGFALIDEQSKRAGDGQSVVAASLFGGDNVDTVVPAPPAPPAPAAPAPPAPAPAAPAPPAPAHLRIGLSKLLELLQETRKRRPERAHIPSPVTAATSPTRSVGVSALDQALAGPPSWRARTLQHLGARG